MIVGPQREGPVQGISGLAVAAAVIAASAAYVLVAAAYFPNAQQKMGDDYEYFLPLLLAGKYWIAGNGLLSVPWFTPGYCGGLPFFGNPQSIFYSAPQALSLFLNPVASFLATTVVFAFAGMLGTFVLMRQRFGVSPPAAWLSAVIFLFNGLLLHRMTAGHVTYHVFGLVPLLCLVLLTPAARQETLCRSILRTAGPVAVAAAVLVYFVYGGAPNILVPLALACAAVWLVHGLVRKQPSQFWRIGGSAAVIALAASAAKLAPAIVLIHLFPRPHAVVLIDDPIFFIRALSLGLFAPSLLADHLWVVGKHEFNFGVGLVPPLLLLGAYFAYRRRRRVPRPGGAAMARLAGLVLLFAVPICLNYGGPGYAAWLKSLPYIGENIVLIRWFFIYMMPLIVGSGLALDSIFASAPARCGAAAACMLLTVAPVLAALGPEYDLTPYDPARVVAAAEALHATGAVPAITRIGVGTFGARNDGLVSGASNYPCYEAVFGFQLEGFPHPLDPGPILTLPSSGRHLRNPACYIYGPENGCAPGEGFADAQRQAEAAFAAYGPFAYVVPAWQIWANRASILGLVAILAGLGIGAWQCFASRRQQA
jgi:hypothetical protein